MRKNSQSKELKKTITLSKGGKKKLETWRHSLESKGESSSDVRNDTNGSLRWTNERSKVDRRGEEGQQTVCYGWEKILPKRSLRVKKVNGAKRKIESFAIPQL